MDDIIITLDVDLDDELVYKELNAGLTRWRKQQRELKKQGLGEKSPPDIITSSKGNYHWLIIFCLLWATGIG